MSPKSEDEIIINIKKMSTFVGAAVAINVLISASFGVFWTNFLRYKVDERIEVKVGRKTDLSLRILRDMDPVRYEAAVQKEPAFRALRGDP